MSVKQREEAKGILEEAVSAYNGTDSSSVDMGPSEGLDMYKRDPNGMNDHVKTQFADVIGEPDGAHSGDCIWQNSFRCFSMGKGCCYRMLTFICAIPLAFLWGCQFACITFSHIWFVTPCFRVFDINFDCFKKFWGTCVSCLCDPCNLSAALVFSKINVTNNNN